MGGSSPKQQQGAHERTLIQVGGEQAAYAEKFNPFTDKVVEHAQADVTELLRGRANSDAAQAFKDAPSVIQGGHGLASFTEQGGMQSEAATGVLRDASKTAMMNRDKAIATAGGLLFNRAGASSRGLGEVARMESKELAQKAELAQQRRADNMQTVGAVAGMGASAYHGYSMDKKAYAGLSPEQRKAMGVTEAPSFLGSLRNTLAGTSSPYQLARYGIQRKPGG